VLQQYDEPAQLLSRPANNFVAKFIGLGRGYRWLQLIDASGLPMHDMKEIAANDLCDTQSARVVDGWTLVVNDDGVPLGWIDADGLRRHRGGASLPDSISAVGAQFRPGGNLSQALDAALSSPSSMGIAVDHEDKVIGGILATDVLAVVEARRRA
jgi:osmoprotectant transport system ATP-binding protein